MDAASKIKTILVVLVAGFSTTGFAYGDDSDTTGPCKGLECKTATAPEARLLEGMDRVAQVCEPGKYPAYKGGAGTVEVVVWDVDSFKSTPESGFPKFLSEWLSKTPKFSAQVASQLGTEPRDLESVRFELADSNLNIVQPSDSFVNVAVPVIRQPITKPMKFTEQISRLQLGEFIGDVIICGHRICTGTKCYDVKDEPVAGTPCDKSDETKVDTNEEEEQILVLPIAPPAPPGGEIAQFSDPIFSENMDESEASSILRNSGLGNVNISLPVTTVVDLLVAKTELSTRLEMTCQLMDERQLAMDKIQSLANRNATLATQLAVAEARNQMSDALTASVVERAELAIKLASVEPKSSKISGASSVVQTIQEDLSNIRRQIALLRKLPVPFAQSVVGKAIPQPYIPTAQLPASQLTRELETTCAGDDASEHTPVSGVK